MAQNYTSNNDILGRGTVFSQSSNALEVGRGLGGAYVGDVPHNDVERFLKGGVNGTEAQRRITFFTHL